jgi:hypothetical protein
MARSYTSFRCRAGWTAGTLLRVVSTQQLAIKLFFYSKFAGHVLPRSGIPRRPRFQAWTQGNGDLAGRTVGDEEHLPFVKCMAISFSFIAGSWPGALLLGQHRSTLRSRKAAALSISRQSYALFAIVGGRCAKISPILCHLHIDWMRLPAE